MAESVVRFKRGRGFTTIYNSVAQDDRLTLATRGLFSLMASLPQDWDYSVSGLAVKAKTSRYEIRKCLDNLQEVGYLEREQSHDPSGKFSGNVYVLQEEAPPVQGEPSTVVPNCHNGNSRQRCLPLSVKLTQQKKDLNTPKTDKAPIPPPRRFVTNVSPEICYRILEYAPDDQDLQQAILDLLENRRVANKRPVKTLRAMDGILLDLDKLSSGNRGMKLLLLNKAVKCNWLTVYALKPDELPVAALAVDSSEEVDLDGI
ncbi:hypothetical protein [uncultured Oscillibacter sp.]|uniref:hypothetical protein n=1 Tax=uncultured Oscillibacter sp. TaxID=876091 RepID=UPI0025FC8EB5|nr:hypothetical protein [uncultured Oscillibacter sp.]